MSDDIRFILEQAILAPSGDNDQPWRWIVRGETLELWGDRNESSAGPVSALYGNSNENTFSRDIVLGTAIENAVLAASIRGYRVEVAYTPDANQPAHAATLSLVKDASVTPDPLAFALPARVTNRKPFQHTSLSERERKALEEANAGNASWGELRLLDDRASIKRLAHLASLNDELLFGIRALHNYIFSCISWTKRADDRRRTGFYFPVLATPPFSWFAMQLIRHWWIMRVGIFFGLEKIISFEQRFLTYRNAGAFGAVVIRGTEPADRIRAGRFIERFWIAANAAGLSFQPLNGTAYFAKALENGVAREVFSEKQRARLAAARAEINRLFGVDEGTLVFMFRTGHSGPPIARTSRLPLEEVVTVEGS